MSGISGSSLAMRSAVKGETFPPISVAAFRPLLSPRVERGLPRHQQALYVSCLCRGVHLPHTSRPRLPITAPVMPGAGPPLFALRL